MNVLRVTMFHRRFTATEDENGTITGYDGNIFQIIKEHLNLEIILKSHEEEKYGFQDINGTFTGSLGDIVYNEADVAMNSVFIKDYNTTGIEFSVTTAATNLCVAVPSSDLIPLWKVAFLCFETLVWASIGFFYVTSVYFLCFLRKYSKEKSNVVSSSLIIFRLMLMSSIRMPYRVSQRIFLMSLILTSFIVSSVYQGRLLTFLTRRSYEKEIETIEELYTSGYQVYTHSKNLQNDTFQEIWANKFGRRVHLLDSDNDLVGEVDKNKNIAVLGRKDELVSRIEDHISFESEKVSVHVMRECPRSYLLAYIFHKGSPFYKRINRILGLLVQSGITQSHRINSGFKMFGEKYKLKNQYSEQPQPLTLNNVVISFFILIIGYVLSVIVFLCEIFRGPYVKQS